MRMIESKSVDSLCMCDHSGIGENRERDNSLITPTKVENNKYSTKKKLKNFFSLAAGYLNIKKKNTLL